MKTRAAIWALGGGIGLAGLTMALAKQADDEKSETPQPTAEMNEKTVKSDAEWRQQLTDEQYRVTRKKGTERAFTGKYHDHHDKGTYTCVCCGTPLFSSETKFDSGTGWPSFWALADKKTVGEKSDFGLYGRRTEVICNQCDAHLGHVFRDGPKPTGLRYCINSAALDFTPADPPTAQE